MEKIAIIIGKLGDPTYLEQCIESVTQQSSDRWELYLPVISDNDGYQSAISKYENNPAIHLIADSDGLSYAETLNTLIKNTDCEIIGLVDGNDSLNEFCVEKILHFYEAFCNTGLIYTNYMIIGQDNQPKILGDCIPLKPWQNLLDHKLFGPFISFKKQYFNLTGRFDAGLTNAEEIDIAYKLDEVTKHYFINEPLYFKREMEQSVNRKDIDSIKNGNIKIARQNAFKRRGVPNTDNPIIKFLNMDYYSVKKLKYKKGKRVIDPVIGIENLVNAKMILDKYNMKNWLTDGTLLGYYRDNEFIKNDEDLDMGSFIADYDDRIVLEFLNNGWETERFFGRRELGLELSLKRKNLKLDIFFFYEDEDKSWHACWVKTDRGINMVKYLFEKFDLKEIDFSGHKQNIPKDTLKYLTAKYGETWNTPVKEWDYVNSPPNAEKTNIYF